MAISALSTRGEFAPTFVTDAITVDADQVAYMGVWSYVDETNTPNDAECANWELIGRVTIGDTSHYPIGMTVLRREGPFSGAQTLEWDGQMQAYARWQIALVTDADVATPEIQVKTAQTFPSAPTTTITAAFTDPLAPTSQVLVFSGDWDLTTESIESGYGTIYNNPDANIGTCATWDREDAGDDDPTVTASSSTWLGIIAIEIRAAGVASAGVNVPLLGVG